MKLAFSTLGCPDWDMDTIIARAAEYEFDGVDFRGYMGEMNICTLPEFGDRAARTAQRFADAGLEVPCFSSSARLVSKAGTVPDGALDEIKAYAALCPAFGARFIRVFGGAIGETPREQAIEAAAWTLREMAAIAADGGLTVLVETHDDWVDSRHLLALMQLTDSEAAGILWDIHHPWRRSGESPETTWQRIGRYVRYTHWKDAVSTENHRLCLVGEGDLPLAAFHQTLVQGGYDGYYTLEWEKKWHPDLPDAETAFPAYVRFMRGLL
ncbi:MAG: sugar phosphate isomerase/epimerase [Kiritimatiellae bacterium]|nr:sugar phosphate isomerase/epimerase [Kiritimatiellia bacterium]